MFKFIKRILLKVWDWYSVEKRWCSVQRHSLSVMNSQKTIAYIKKNKCSIARYGDGEFDLMYKGKGEDYQQCSAELSNALQGVLENHSPNLLICIPYPLVSLKGMKKHAKKFWKMWSIENFEKTINRVLEKTGNNYCFGDSFVSRPYTGFKSRRHPSTIIMSSPSHMVFN